MAQGPRITVEKTEVALKDVAWAQEQLALVGLEYSLLGYTPVDQRAVAITVNGAQKLLGTDFVIDGRKVQYTPELASGDDVVIAVYPTAGPIADAVNYEIAFDIPGQNIRQNGDSGTLQILNDGTWYDMVVSAHPITGVLTFDVSQDASLNQ